MVMFDMGWQRGQRLGYKPTAPLAGRSDESFRGLSQASHPEMWLTLAGTLASKDAALSERLKRTQNGDLEPVQFTFGHSIKTMVELLTWHELSQALVAMTTFNFSDLGTVYDWDDLSGSWLQEDLTGDICMSDLLSVAICLLNCSRAWMLQGMVISGQTPWQLSLLGRRVIGKGMQVLLVNI